jgi:hypothetical protein
MMKPLLYLLAGAVLGALGVGGGVYFSSHQSADTSASIVTPSPSVASTTNNDDAPPPAVSDEIADWGDCTQGDQVFQPSPTDQAWSTIPIYTVTSVDGVTFENKQLFTTGGAVPSVTRGTDGTLVAVYQWFPTDNPAAYNKVAVKRSLDNGQTWSEPQLICLHDFPQIQAPFDPTIVATSDGRYRLFFTTHALGIGTTLYYASAISNDGIHYVYEGTAFDSGQSTADGSVTQINDRWYMIAPLAMQNGRALDATSTNGQQFTQSQSNRSDKMYWVGNIVNALNNTGEMRFYGSTVNGPLAIGYSSSTDGQTWSDPVVTNLPFGGDVAVTTTADDRYLLIYVEPPAQVQRN